MIRISAFLVLFLSLTACSSGGPGGANDLAEYGLRGKVRRVTTYTYEDIHRVEGRWEFADKDQYVGKTVLVFNESGNLDSLSNRFLADETSEEWIGTVFAFQYKGGKKSGATHYDLQRGHVATAEITWLDDRHYRMVEESEGQRLESENWLNEDYRDMRGKSRMWLKDELVWEEEYQNKLDADERIIETRVIRPLEEEDFVTRPEDVELDDQGNIVRYWINLTPDEGEGKLMVREIEYAE